MDKSACCLAGPHCTSCGAAEPTVCTECEADYLLDGRGATEGHGGCVSRPQCQADPASVATGGGECLLRHCGPAGVYGEGCATCGETACLTCAGGGLLVQGMCRAACQMEGCDRCAQIGGEDACLACPAASYGEGCSACSGAACLLCGPGLVPDMRSGSRGPGRCIPEAGCGAKLAGVVGGACADLGCASIRNCDECGLPEGYSRPEGGGGPDTAYCRACSTGRSGGVSCPALSGGAIAGIVVGVLAVVGLAGGLTWYLLQRRKRQMTGPVA